MTIQQQVKRADVLAREYIAEHCAGLESPDHIALVHQALKTGIVLGMFEVENQLGINDHIGRN